MVAEALPESPATQTEQPVTQADTDADVAAFVAERFPEGTETGSEEQKPEETESPSVDTEEQDAIAAKAEALAEEKLKARQAEEAAEKAKSDAESQKQEREARLKADFANRARAMRAELAKDGVEDERINAHVAQLEAHHALSRAIASEEIKGDFWNSFREVTSSLLPESERKDYKDGFKIPTNESEVSAAFDSLKAAFTRDLKTPAQVKAETTAAVLAYKKKLIDAGVDIPGSYAPTALGGGSTSASAGSEDARLLDPNTPINEVQAILARRGMA